MGDKEDNFSIGSILRERGKKSKTDIGEVWSVNKKTINKKSLKTKTTSNIPRTIMVKVTETTQDIWSSVKLITKKLYSIKMLFLVLLTVAIFYTFISRVDNDKPQQLGANDLSVGNETPEVDTASNLHQVLSTEFKLLLPDKKSIEDYEVVKVSPPGNDVVYAYIDVINGVEIRISQQRIPEEFKNNVAEKVREVAEDFQATDIIEVDGSPVYNGLTERYGGVQSLVFEKNDLLVLISSAKKFSDIEWASYVSQLN